MIRLRDESALDPVSERGIEILRQVEPPPRPPEMKWRVWAALQQTPEGASSGLRPGRFKALVLGAGILAFAATAVGAAGGHWIAQRVQRLRAPQAGPAAAAQQHPRVVRRLASLPVPPVVEPIRAPVAQPVEAPAPAREPERVHHVAPSPARERTQVLDALDRASPRPRCGAGVGAAGSLPGDEPPRRAARRGPGPGHRGRRRARGLPARPSPGPDLRQ